MTAAIVLRVSAYAVWVEVRQVLRGRQVGTLAPTAWLIVLIALLGTLFGTILKGSLTGYGTYLPFLASGLIAWTFMAATLTETCLRTPQWAGILRHTPVPLAVVATTVLLRQLLILGQNLMLALGLDLVWTGSLPVRRLAFAAGLTLLTAIAYCMAHVGAVLSLRYRTVPQMVAAMLQAAFFMTPLIWPDYFLGRYRFLNDVNPFYHLVGLIRDPVLGQPTPFLTWAVGVGVLAVGAFLAWRLDRLARSAACYWL